MPKPPWFPYRVIEDDFLNADCEEFTSVSHVTHVENALAIVRRGALRPQLVYDESKLRKRRILVVWLSPNYWHEGFRYGNISFEFDFSELIDRKRIYWVEDIKHTPNSPTACRILVTTVDRDNDKHMTPYDPCAKDGPWWWDRHRKKHFRNPRFTLEFMLESDLEVTDCLGADFVKHHRFQCCIDPANCPECDYTPERGGALFTAGIVGERLDASEMKMFCVGKSGKRRPSGRLELACSRIQNLISKADCTGSIRSKSGEAVAVGRAAMSALYRRNKKEFVALCALFKDSSQLSLTVEGLIKEAFKLDSCFEE